jgi:bacterioferritin
MATDVDQDGVIKVLNRILEAELAGVVRYTHYSLMVFGFNRIPITKWLRDQAEECLAHAQQAGEMVTHLGAHPSLEKKDLVEGDPNRQAAGESAARR